jgi:hypothetical protein
MPDWALRLGAAILTAVSMAGSISYALAHPKNPSAPLQPPVAERDQMDLPTTPTRTLPFRTLAPTEPPPATTAPALTPPPRASTPTQAPAPTLRPTPTPRSALGAAVRATTLPRVTVTHSS